MSNFGVVFVLILGALIVGGLLFIPMRWLALRKAPTKESSPQVTRGQYVQAIVIVAGLLVLVWFVEAGNQAAGIAFATIMLIATIWGGIIVRKAKQQKEDSQP